MPTNGTMLVLNSTLLSRVTRITVLSQTCLPVHQAVWNIHGVALSALLLRHEMAVCAAVSTIAKDVPIERGALADMN